MGLLAIVLLACAVLLIIGAEWPRLVERFGADARTVRGRTRRKQRLTLVRGDRDDFAASVRRDLSNLPVIGERDDRSRH